MIMKPISVWTLPKSERNRVYKWRADIRKEISTAEHSISNLQNRLTNEEFKKKTFEIQLGLLEEKFLF